MPSNTERIKVLVLGSAGMLGQALVRKFQKSEKYEVVGWDRDEINLINFIALEKALGDLRPTIVINAAAYNAVDKCEESEEEYAKALELNGKLPEALVHLSKAFGFLLVHYSTDYVFDGKSMEAYREDAKPHPLSKYGATKLVGEEAVQKNAEQFYLIRLSKLFGMPGTSAVAKKSFFDVMLEKGKRGEKLQVVDGEKSCFTYAPDLAEATHQLIEARAAFGIYHLPNSGDVTWYEGVGTLFRLAGLKVTVMPVPPETFPRPAKRPAFSVLANTKRPLLWPYTEALSEYLRSMVQCDKEPLENRV